MTHFINGENLGIDLCRQLVSDNYSHIFITNIMVDDSLVSNKLRERGYICPLYLYPETKAQQSIDQTNKRKPNLNTEIVNQIAKDLDLTFTNEKEATKDLCTNRYFRLHLCRFTFTIVPKKVQEVFKNRFSESAVSNQCCNFSAVSSF